MNRLFAFLIMIVILQSLPVMALAEADIEVNTPAVANLKQRMLQRYSQLAAHYNSGAVGLTRDGLIAMRDANVVALDQRQLVNALIATENQDRNALYREIARANNHPEWEHDIRSIFSQRWVSLARHGWWYQAANDVWTQKLD